MKWKILTLWTLLMLSMTVALLFYAPQSFEMKKLVLSALKCGTTPQEFVDISTSPYREQIIAVINTSVILGHEIEISEHSPLREWAESVLGDSNWRLIFIKTGDQYYRVIVEYLEQRFSYPTAIAIVPFILTLITWMVYFALLLAKKT